MISVITHQIKYPSAVLYWDVFGPDNLKIITAKPVKLLNAIVGSTIIKSSLTCKDFKTIKV